MCSHCAKSSSEAAGIMKNFDFYGLKKDETDDEYLSIVTFQLFPSDMDVL